MARVADSAIAPHGPPPPGGAGPARRLLAVAAACAGCSGESARPAPPPPPPVQDAAIDAAPALPSVDPAAIPEGTSTAPLAPGRPRGRTPRPIDVTLKSEPHGALAAVDGRPIGKTPTFWAGESDGLEHEFTFTLAGHAYARYRFVPLTSGVLHVKLQPVAEETPDGGLEPLIAPKFAPATTPPAPGDAAAPPPPPPPLAPPEPAPGSGSGSGSGSGAPAP